jgi:hypothetical protein
LNDNHKGQITPMKQTVDPHELVGFCPVYNGRAKLEDFLVIVEWLEFSCTKLYYNVLNFFSKLGLCDSLVATSKSWLIHFSSRAYYQLAHSLPTEGKSTLSSGQPQSQKLF